MPFTRLLFFSPPASLSSPTVASPRSALSPEIVKLFSRTRTGFRDLEFWFPTLLTPGHRPHSLGYEYTHIYQQVLLLFFFPFFSARSKKSVFIT